MKVDLKKTLKDLYSPSAKTPQTVSVPEMSFLMVDGHGDPNTSPEYAAAVQTLYTLSYTLKFMVKKAGAADYAVMPLEGLWWSNDMTDFLTGNKSNWDWTAIMMQPEYVNTALFEQALVEVKKKKPAPVLAPARFAAFNEGPSAQIMYFGPYADEGPTIARLHQFITDSGHKLRGKHHEIYLGNPQRTAPEKLRTIVRQPME